MLEKLATFTVDSSEKMGMRISSLEEGQNSLKQGQVRLEQGQEEIKQEVSSLKTDHKDTNQRVVSIKRKLVGTQISLDETVHRAEFKKLERRVEALESQYNAQPTRILPYKGVFLFTDSHGTHG